MKLEKFEKWCEFASKGITSYDFAIMLISYLLMGLFKDLGFENALRVSGGIFMAFVIFYLCTFICLLVLVCIKKHRSKKTNIEKLIDEELKK